jgi:hypothetical protein
MAFPSAADMSETVRKGDQKALNPIEDKESRFEQISL